MNIYKEHGFANRNEYLEYLSENYDVDLDAVVALSELFGEEEDFDGLVSAVADSNY